MRSLKVILMMGMALIISSCAYDKIERIPITPSLVKMDFGQPFPFEAGLLITEQTRGQVFQSKKVPDILTQYFYYVLEPYQLPVGQALEEVSLQIFSNIFQKIHLIRTLEEGNKYPLIIEPKLLDFDYHLIYSTIPSHLAYQVVIDGRSEAKASLSLTARDRSIWENSYKTPVMFRRWFDDYLLRKNMGDQTWETLTLALEELAYRMLEETRKPQTAKGWLEELNLKGPNPASPQEMKK